MAATPAFANVARIGVASVATANTARDGTGTVATIIAGVAAGTRVERIVVKSTGDPADSVVNLFLHDGSAFWLFDAFDLGDPAAGSTTVDSYRAERGYSDLVLPSTSWTVRASITVAPTAGVVNVFAFVSDLT